MYLVLFGLIVLLASILLTRAYSGYLGAITMIVGLYLVTWNCKHIANAFMLRKIEQVVQAKGYTMPVVCTPEELMEEIQDERSDS